MTYFVACCCKRIQLRDFLIINSEFSVSFIILYPFLKNTANICGFLTFICLFLLVLISYLVKKTKILVVMLGTAKEACGISGIVA